MKTLPAIVFFAFVWLMVPGAHATGTSNDSIPDYTGILIVTGGVLPSVQVQGDYTVNNFSTTKSLSGTYRVGYKLINGSDNPVSPEVFSPAFAVALLPHASTSGTRSVALSPNFLTSSESYRVYSQLYTAGPTPGSWVAAGFSSTSGEYRFALVDSGTDSGLVAQLNTLALTRTYAVVTAPASDSFQISAQGVVGRLDQVAQPVVTEHDQIFFDVTIIGDHTGSILIANPRTTLPVVLANHTAGGTAASIAIDQTIDIRPGVQMDSTDSYTLTVTMSHARPGAAEVVDRQIVLTAQRFLHFNGTLMFGSVSATVTAIYNDPDFEGTVAGVGENTALGIDANGAHLNANPSYVITSGQNFHVLLGIDGTATSTDTANLDVLTGVSPEAGVLFTLSGVTLDSAGAHATSGRVRFPAGFGVAAAPNIRRLMADYPFGAIDLDASMNPTGVVGLSPAMVDAQHLFAVHEDLPEQFEASSISWDTAAGTFAVHRTGTRHVRADETTALDALALTAETLVAKIRPSNDGYLGAPGPGGVDVVVRADAQGRAILEDATIDLPPSQFTTHFPADTVVSWSEAGQLVIKAGLIDTAQSALPGAAPATFETLPGAPGLTLVGGLESFSFKPSEDTWHFTADGGLRAEGAITDGTVRWGARGGDVFAQTAGVFATGAAHVPGNVLRGSLAATLVDFRPGELLLSGHGKPGDAAYVERPFTPGYTTAGFADYAGLNVRSTGGGAQTGTSLLGDATLGPYPLSAASKYYFRKAGVSGIHSADRSFFSAKGIPLTMDGFALTLTDYQLSYRDNKNIDSLVSGTVDIPGVRGKPGFTQAFSKMLFDSQGQPTELALVQNAALTQPLSYWHARFHPITAEFVLKPSDAKQVALVFGAEVLLPGILKDPVRGGLGFLPSGKLASAADGFPGVNSRMKPPKQIGLHGPGSSVNANIPAFIVNPVGDFYFNDPYFSDPNNPVAPADGFVAFAGSIQVPFFENMLVHVIARADTGRTAIRAGWQKGQKSFFTDVNFDAGNVGFPASDGYDAYVNENEPDGFTYFVEGDVNHQRNLYNPLVRQSWLGVVDFALPVKWDPARHRFVSSVPEERAFLILTSQRVLQQLTPSGAEIRFGLQFNRLPRVSLTSLLISDHEAAQDAEELIRFIPDGPKLSAAVGAFENLLSGNSNQLIADGFDGVLDTFLDYLLGNGGPLNGLTAATDATKAIGTSADQAFKDLAAKLKDQLSSAAGALNLANSIFGKVADGLDIVDNGLSTADTILQKDKNGQRGAFITNSIQIATSLGLPDESVKSVTGSITSEINGELAPTLDEISNSLDDVHSLSQSARKLVNGGRDVTAKALGTVNIAETLPNAILSGLHDYLNQLHDPTGQALTELGPDKLRAALKKAALDAIMGSDFVAQLQETLRDLVEPLHEEYGVVYEQIFGVLNDVVRSALEELNNQVIDHLNDEAGKINRAVGDFRNALELSKVEGNAQILGNVLDNAHLNATFGLSVPDKVALTGTIDFKRLHGDQPVPPCVTGAADGSLQIKVTARGDASLGGNRAAHAELHGQYTMNALGDPLAVSGGLSLDADVHVDVITLKKADFEFVVGGGDNYVRAEGAGSILVFDVNTRAFFGKTCDPDLVKWIDPQIDALLTKLGRPQPVGPGNPLIGYYMMADGDVVLNRILDIPDSVVLLKAGGGQGSFIFCNPTLTSIIPGMHTRLSIGVGLGPVSEQAELVALGGLAPIPLTTSSTGLPNVAASFLADPFNALKGAVAGRFTPKFTAGPISWSKDFDFTATGTYIPPPVAPPPGLFLVKTLDF